MLVAINTAKETEDETGAEVPIGMSQAQVHTQDTLIGSDLEDLYGPPPPTQEEEEPSFESVLAEQQAARARLEEDPPERRAEGVVLGDLPLHNDKRFPQENKAYMSKKNYCRNDKYDLDDFVCRSIAIPSIATVFSLKPKAKAVKGSIKFEE